MILVESERFLGFVKNNAQIYVAMISKICCIKLRVSHNKMAVVSIDEVIIIDRGRKIVDLTPLDFGIMTVVSVLN